MTIGEYAFIGAGSVVPRDVPAYALVFGVPGVIQGWVSKAGRRLAFDGNHVARCPEDGRCYRLVDGGRVEVLED